MGQEYRISSRISALEELKTLCLLLGGTHPNGYPTAYEFRSQKNEPSSAMPDASVQLHDDHIWFCDYGGPKEFVAPVFLKLLNVALRHSDGPDGIRIEQP
jgi:hypothetical protein